MKRWQKGLIGALVANGIVAGLLYIIVIMVLHPVALLFIPAFFLGIVGWSIAVEGEGE